MGTDAAMDIRTRRGFPQLLENSLEDSAFSQSHRLDDGLNINPFQRQQSTLRPGISVRRMGTPSVTAQHNRERASVDDFFYMLS